MRLAKGILGYGILAYFLRDTGMFVFFILGYAIFEFSWRYDIFAKTKEEIN